MKARQGPVAYCPNCDAMTEHRPYRVLETHPINFGRKVAARCLCGHHQVIGMPPTPENMERLRARWGGARDGE